MIPRVLIIAGSDSGGGAGIQADLKAVTAMGGWGMTAIASLTAQSPQGVYGIHDVPPEFVAQQMDVVLRDLGADAVKTGMLSSSGIIRVVARRIADYAAVRRREGVELPVVIDPVMVATSGARLLREEAVAALIEELLPLATVLTPNVPEAEVLAGTAIEDEATLKRAGERIHALMETPARLARPACVLMKGGHLPGPDAVDWLFDGASWRCFRAARVPVSSTHGTGCTYASALAAALPGQSVDEAVKRAKQHLTGLLTVGNAGSGGV